MDNLTIHWVVIKVNDIYTIGYSAFNLEKFISVLKKYRVNSLIDVRSNPTSSFYEDFNKNNLEQVLKNNGILYRNYKNEFGARQDNPILHKKGFLDFEEFAKTEIFQSGVRKIEAGIRLNYTFAFMCAEKDPSTCHRNIMVAKEFHKLGYTIKNILEDESFETQESIENRLVEQYFPDRDQIDLFNETLSWEEMVRRSYQIRNSEIGYRIEDEPKVKIS